MEASIEELKGELRLGASREREEATARLVERMEGDFRDERERRAELKERVKALMALEPASERGEAKGEGSKGDLGAAVTQVGAGDSMEASRSYSDVARQSPGGAGQGAPTAGSGPRVGGTQRARTGAQQSQAGSKRLERRRVLVVGDPNVARVEEGVFTTVKADRRVRVEAQSGKCMMDALTKAQEVVGDSMAGENLVIIFMLVSTMC
ncbi:hypothetical protein HPB52_000949 [Rhipicephalus sanguineus]|uniref:Uncharacterized protein n=1 Tax=Rhipicephalus sanguineus TaxID=34632 RepID=A0A9D4PMI3_RHISA|nr:hypothetical protein HPB52_000949 [Rhipicephalus sanguineus]